MSAEGEAVHRTRLTEDKTKIVKPKVKYKLRENYYSVRVVKKWNQLPQKVREAKTINSFKNMYDEWLENRRN